MQRLEALVFFGGILEPMAMVVLKLARFTCEALCEALCKESCEALIGVCDFVRVCDPTPVLL